MNQNLLRGTTYAVSATSAVGSSVAVSGLLVGYPSLASQAARYLLAALALLVLVRVRRFPLPRLPGRDLAMLFALAATGQAGFNLCMLQALRYAEPAAVGVVVGGVPVVLALAGPLLGRRRVSARLIVAAILASTGAAVVHGGGAASAEGLAWALGAMLGEISFSLLAIALVDRLGPLVVSLYACAAAAAMLTVGAALLDGTAAVRLPTGTEAAAIVYLGVVVNGAGTVGWYAGLRRLGVERAGIFAAVIPLATLPSAVLVGTGTVGLREAAGAGLVGLAILTGLRQSRGHRRAAAVPPADARPAPAIDLAR